MQMNYIANMNNKMIGVFFIFEMMLSSIVNGGIILKDEFNYTSNSEFTAGGWKCSNGSSYAYPWYRTTDNGENNCLVLYNRFIYRTDGFDSTITNYFSVQIDIQHNTASGRQQWVLVSGEPDEEGVVRGYSFSWANITKSVYLCRFEGAMPDKYIASQRKGEYGNDLASAVTPIVALTTDPTLLSQFETFNFTWDSSGSLTLSAEGYGVLATVEDTSYSSFSQIYISGNANGYFDNLIVRDSPQGTVITVK